MTADEARERLKRMYRLALGRDRIERTEQKLKVRIMDVWHDDDLIVIFADEAWQA